jgi:hypothetical protein
MGCALDGRVSIPNRGKTFLHNVPTGSGVHPVSYVMDTGAIFGRLSGRGKKLTTHLLVRKSIMAELCLHYFIRFHGVVLN